MGGNKKTTYLLLLGLLFLTPYTNVNGQIKPNKPTNETGQEEIADIYLNFENASLASVVNYLSEQKKINIIPNKKLEGQKVTLSTREPLTLTRAWNVLLTLLEMNEFSIINVDDVYRIVESKANQKEPLPFYSSLQGTNPQDLPDNDQVVRYIYVLKNISTTVADKILTGLLGTNSVKTNKDLATCIMTDKSFNIKSAMKIIEELDKGGMRESIQILKLKHTNAKEVADIFSNKIFDKQDSVAQRIRFIGPQQQKEIAYFSSATKIIPEERQNALILLGLQQNINRIVDFINTNIDVSMGSAESRIHIRELKYIEAPAAKTILDTITKHPEGQKGETVIGEFKFFEDIKIQAEKPGTGDDNKKISKGSGNRLIVSCGNDDWTRLEAIISKLDKPQPQVALEVMVVDIDASTEKQLGTQIQEKSGQSFAKGMSSFTSNLRSVKVEEPPAGETAKQYDQTNIAGIIDGNLDQIGSTMLTLGRTGNIWSIIKSVFTANHTNIISQPFLVTSNNEECTFIARETRQVPGKLIAKNGVSNRQLDTLKAATNVTITPRINLSGLIDLKIKITLSEFLSGSETQPPTSDRQLETRASMATGEVLILGGMTKDGIDSELYKTPIFSDIPIIGNLFKNRIKENNKTNLYIFIRPSIIKPKFDGGPDDYTDLKLAYAKLQIGNAEELKNCKDPIQRWFFKPEGEDIDQKLRNLKRGIYRPIDDYSEGKSQPNLVRIERDPYYRVSEELTKIKKENLSTKEENTVTATHRLAKNKKLEQFILPSLRKKQIKT